VFFKLQNSIKFTPGAELSPKSPLAAE